MKKMTSVGSTRPQQFLYTDFSTIAANNTPKPSLLHITDYLFNLLKLRDEVYFCIRDTEQLYQLQPVFFNTLLGVSSGQQLWDYICNQKHNKNQEDSDEQKDHVRAKQERGGEKQMNALITKIIIGLTKQKNECAEAKQIDRFAELKKLIDWLQRDLLNLQKQIRQKKKQSQIRKHEAIKKHNEDEYRQYQQSLKTHLQNNKRSLAKQIKKKHKQEKGIQETFQENQINHHKYIYRPSKKLSEAKDLSLLTKLAPYKSEKKRPYECKYLQKNLEDIADQARNTMVNRIQEFKQAQRNKIRHRQQIQKDHKLFKAQQENKQILSKTERAREERRKSEDINLKRFIQEHNKATNQRISSLKKSLNRYSMQDQSRKIRQIIHKHRQTIQFVNDIDKINATEQHSQLNIYDTSIDPDRYHTLDHEAKWITLKEKIKKQKTNVRYSDKNTEKKILRRIQRERNNQQDTRSIENSKTGRKSLIDLYDNQLKQVSE